jgi:hypothetical protein
LIHGCGSGADAGVVVAAGFAADEAGLAAVAGFAGVVWADAAAVKAAKDRKRIKRFMVRDVSG